MKLMNREIWTKEICTKNAVSNKNGVYEMKHRRSLCKKVPQWKVYLEMVIMLKGSILH